ncbi:hypothetical protein [Halorubrum sp. Atlit-26R]|uniref:hypothetical protein n=1 Tax=Halorubrum sp. Atlit-26R TaxID=2282128 RepID=UPI000EF1B5AB|nr:hypothetical protein [Halorubrum sp. Atlit-26R]RLM68516.1 hypothetical protein DVK07_10365 [Halorubrum sp. Atlit-26R]
MKLDIESPDETTKRYIVNYRKRDSEELAYHIRALLETNDRVELWAAGERQLATVDSDGSAYEPEEARGVLVGGEQIHPEDVDEIQAITGSI